MVQGISDLGAMQPQGGGLPSEVVDVLGKGFSSLSSEEVSQLRELQDSLGELSPDKLKILEQILVFLKKNSDRYDDAVRLLVSKGILEPGDLPPDYIPAFFEILDKMVLQAMSGEQPFAKGGIASLRKKASDVRMAGTGGDKILAHINPREAAMLQATRGGGKNPYTGLPEYGFFDDIGNFFKSAASVVLPVALGLMGVPPVFAGAIGSGIGAMINGASPDKALQAAVLGGVTGAAFSGISNIGQEGGFMGGLSKGFEPGPGILGEAMGYKAPAVTPQAGYTGAGSPQNYAGGSTLPAGASATSPAVAGGVAPVPQPGMLGGVKNWIAQNPLPAVGIAGLGGLALASAMQPDQSAPDMSSYYKGPSEEDIQAKRFAPGTFDTHRYTGNPEVPTYSPAYPDYNRYLTRYAAKGGVLDARVGGHLEGPGTGTSDSIPAKLSDGEFVMTSKAVRGAGGGSREKGARKMYDLMHQFEKRA